MFLELTENQSPAKRVLSEVGPVMTATPLKNLTRQLDYCFLFINLVTDQTFYIEMSGWLTLFSIV